jgi:hypothetical protein
MYTRPDGAHNGLSKTKEAHMRLKSAGILCFLLVVSSASFADSLSSITPSSFYKYDVEQNATLKGTGLFGNVSTQISVSGPAGDFVQDNSGGSHDGVTGIDTLFMAIPDPALYETGQYTVNVVATDDTGVRTIGPVYFSVIDRPVQPQPPLIFVPENVIGEATSAAGGNVTYYVSSFSFVDAAPPTINCGSHPSGSLFPLGTTPVTCTATDSFGTATASFPVFVTDTVAPTINVPATIVSGTPVVTFTVTATDDVTPSGSMPVTCSPASGSTFSAGTTTVVCHAEDSHNNLGTGSFKVTITGGASAPVLSLPNDITAEATGSGGAPVTFVVTATDSATITCTPASGSTFPLGATNVPCSATSANGTSADSFNVTIVDTTRPAIALPADITSSATSAAGAVVTYTVTAHDLVDGDMPVSCNHLSGSTFPIGTTSVLCTATDIHDNIGFGSFNVTVSADSTPPVLSLPANITAEATSAAGAVVTYIASANDDTDGPVAITCNPASGSTFGLATTTVQCSATDAHNNTANGSFTVTVRDTTGPALSLPANITAEATSAAGKVVTFSATATDLVDGALAVTCSPASGSTFAIATTTVQCSATDAHHNTTHGSFTVTVRDTTAPSLSLPATITKEATSASGATASYTASASDIVDGSVAVTCDHASGSTFAVGSTTVQCSATDAHNNAANGSFLVVVRDTTAPTLSLPANITAEATSPSGAVVTFTATSSDIVDGSVPVTCTPASGSTFANNTTTTVQCTATDAHNNTAHGSFTVSVHDTTPPTIVSITATPSSLATAKNAMVDVTITVIATDASGATTSHIVSVTAAEIKPEDYQTTGALTLKLSADPKQAGLVYTITIQTTDLFGNSTFGTVSVPVGTSKNHAVSH